MKEFEVLISKDKIQKRVRGLGEEISRTYSEQKSKSTPLIVGVLKGSFIFLADLVRQLSIDCELDFVEVSSYSGTESSGELSFHKDIRQSVKGRPVLIVEDIVDTGLTVSRLKKHFLSKGASSVEICAFLHKPSRKKIDEKVDFIGFEIDDHFVVGYGLDYNEKFRNLDEVMIYSE